MKLRHYDGDNRARFITFCTHQRLPVLTNAKFRFAVLNAIEVFRSNYKLLGYVIMPDHVHLVIVPIDNCAVGKIIGEIKRMSAKEIIAMLKAQKSALLSNLRVYRDGLTKYALWQRRCYDHNCRKPEIVWEKIQYCHNDPVRKGLANNPGAWKWSSYRWYEGMAGSLLEMDIAE